jgi:hypothetical protein
MRRNSGGVTVGVAAGGGGGAGTAAGVLLLSVAGFVLSMLMLNQFSSTAFGGGKEGTLDRESPRFVHSKVSSRLAADCPFPGRYGVKL